MPKKSPTRALFIAGFGPIVRDARASRGLYRDVLGIPFEETEGYLHTEAIDGARAFALWPLEQAARSCFGRARWPRSVPVPQAWIEFDVADVAAATDELVARGYRPLVSARTEPWGQVVTRLLGPEGLLVGLTYTPWMRPKRRRSAREHKGP
jgi:catechol 2,3-dioxygenase-like lactoylglutathione lyase family enzyme